MGLNFQNHFSLEPRWWFCPVFPSRTPTGCSPTESNASRCRRATCTSARPPITSKGFVGRFIVEIWILFFITLRTALFKYTFQLASLLANRFIYHSRWHSHVINAKQQFLFWFAQISRREIRNIFTEKPPITLH